MKTTNLILNLTTISAMMLLSQIALATPIQICSDQVTTHCTQLQDINKNLAGAYELTGDITLDPTQHFTPIGSEYHPFTGSFNGNGHIITNLTIADKADSYDIGLFGATNDATINNVGIKNISVSGGCDVGALIGAAKNSKISNCYSNGGSVTGLSGWEALSDSVGGLIGNADQTTTINTSYSTVSVYAESGDEVGGLVGYSDGTINNSYSQGTVTSDNSKRLQEYVFIGGLVGNLDPDGRIANSYSTSKVVLKDPDQSLNNQGAIVGYYQQGRGFNITNCYWNTTTSNETSAVGNIGEFHDPNGLSDNQMKQASSFKNWDFSNVWGINSGASYPYLKQRA